MTNENICNDECCQTIIKAYEKENKVFLENNLIVSFLKNPMHKRLYHQAICNPTQENKHQLDKLFKAFYFEIRFASHIASTIHFNAINYDKRFRKMNTRFHLTLDATVSSEDGETTFKELLADDKAHLIIVEIISKRSILEQVECPILHRALQTLSDKQLEIIQLVYLHGLSDTEVSRVLNISQQSVSKTHKKALKKLYDFISEGGGEVKSRWAL